MFHDPRATLSRSEISRQELVDYLAAVLGRERKIRWNGQLISVPKAIVRAGMLSDHDAISLTAEDIRVHPA